MRTIYVLRLLGFLSVFSLCANSALAQWDSRESNDSDYTAGYSFFSEDIPLELTADRLDSAPTPDGSTLIELVIERANALPLPVDGLEMTVLVDGVPTGSTHTWYGGFINISCNPGQTVTALAALKSDRFQIKQGRGEYSVRVDGACGMHNKFVFNSESPAGQALGIWRIVFGAEYKLARTVGLDFWNKKINVIWPESADFYRWGSVHISRGDHWDVVGHELGHAIYDLADIGRFGGGQHYIDRCYSGSLALSEGWASYFSAWLSVGLQDPDAKFEFMVPRRAPIQFENVPEDVCKGPNNEWRVNAYFWDIIDLNSDGEDLAENFARVWSALFDSKAANVEQAHLKLIQAGFDSDLLNTIWNLNFHE